MKTFIQTLNICSAFAVATVTAAPTAYINAYTLVGCGSVSGAGGVGNVRSYGLTPGICQNIQPFFLSFQGGNPGPCPEGTTATILAYPEELCAGTPISAGTFLPNGSPGDCEEFPVEAGSGGVSAGGQSAEFTCVST